MAAAKQHNSTSPSKKDFTIVRKCTCSHGFQDSEHGLNMRVMNSCRAGVDVRCTVCNSVTKA